MTGKLSFPKWMLTLVATMSLFGCAVHAPKTNPQYVTIPNATSDTKEYENDWLRCVNRSYKFTRTETIDKNAAAETALKACYAEEQVLAATFDMVVIDSRLTTASITSLKSAVKEVIFEKGQVRLVK